MRSTNTKRRTAPALVFAVAEGPAPDVVELTLFVGRKALSRTLTAAQAAVLADLLTRRTREGK